MTPPRAGRWRSPALLVVAAALVAAFVVGPGLLLARRCPASCDPQALGSALAPALAGFLEQTSTTLPDGLVRLVDLWSWWHATKAVICALLVVVCARLGVQVWRRHGSAGRGAAPWWTAAGVVVAAVTVGVSGVLALNVQATAVPLVALLPLLPLVPGPGAAEDAAEHVRALVVTGTGASTSAPVGVLVDQVARYHWTMAAVAGVLATTAAVTAVCAARRRSHGGSALPRQRARSTSVAAVAVFAVVVFGVVCAGSVVAALAPVESLHDLLGTG